jgi:hypothetical protein
MVFAKSGKRWICIFKINNYSMTRSKQQRLKTKFKKMKGGTEEVVYSFFDKELIKKEGKDDYIVICELNEDDESHFKIFEDTITIYTLSKCGDRSGTSILEKIIQSSIYNELRRILFCFIG